MRQAEVYFDGSLAGILSEHDKGKKYTFEYTTEYKGLPVSLTMPRRESPYEFERFPPFFEGLLPEGPQLEALLKRAKLDRQDYMKQLITIGRDLVGAVSIREVKTK